MIEVSHLTKRFGDKLALSDVSFTVNSGEILGFLGPNGAGKSTTMNIITGYLSSTEGTVTIGGHEILAQPMRAKSMLGYLPEQPPLYLDMTVREYLSFLFDLKKVKRPKVDHIASVCEQVKVEDVMGRKLQNLSKGYRQRVGLAQAMLGAPEVLILDEPTVGLDPKQIIEMRDLICALGKSHTIILSSHILSEIQAVCDRVIVINRGVLVADDTPDNLSLALSGDARLMLRVAGPREEVAALLSELPGVAAVEASGSREEGAFDWAIVPAPGWEGDLRRDIFFALAQRGWPLLSLQRGGLTLEEIFLRLTESAAQPDAANPPEDSAAGEAAEPPPGGEEAPALEGVSAPEQEGRDE